MVCCVFWRWAKTTKAALILVRDLEFSRNKCIHVIVYGSLDARAGKNLAAHLLYSAMLEPDIFSLDLKNGFSYCKLWKDWKMKR